VTWSAADQAWENMQQRKAAEAEDETPQIFATPYDDVYVDAEGNYLHAKADEHGDVYLHPVDSAELDANGDGEPTEMEAAAFFGYLNARGLTYDSATEAELEAAADYAATWEADARAGLLGEQTAETEVAEDEALRDWCAEHGVTIEEAAPFIRVALDAVDSGSVERDVAMDRAGEAIRKNAAATDTAFREKYFADKGFHGGMDAALGSLTETLKGGGPDIYTPGVPTKGDHLSEDFDAALGRTLTQMSAEKATRDVARREVRES
jgi:hypothetical protein